MVLAHSKWTTPKSWFLYQHLSVIPEASNASNRQKVPSPQGKDACRSANHNLSGKLQQERGIQGDSWTEEGRQCRGATETFVCVAGCDLSSVGMGNLHPGVFGKQYLCLIFHLPRNSSFVRTPLTWQAGGWGQAEGFSCPLLYSKNTGIRLEDAWDVAAAKVTRGWRGGHPVIIILLSFLYSPSQITSWCDAAGSAVLVHEESWSRAQREGKCEGEIGERLIGEDIVKDGTEWEGASSSVPAPWGTCPLSLLRWFTKNTRVY